jgi:hypothetical protein
MALLDAIEGSYHTDVNKMLATLVKLYLVSPLPILVNIDIFNKPSLTHLCELLFVS